MTDNPQTYSILGSTEALARAALPTWLPEKLVPINNDLDARIVLPGQDARWMQTGIAGLSLRVFDFVDRGPSWICGELLLDSHADPVELAAATGLEFFVRQGEFNTSGGIFSRGLYLRVPPTVEAVQHVQLAYLQPPGRRARVYFTAGQMLPSDTEARHIDTLDPDAWLPGPVDGIEVMPLHGHGSHATMLVRWVDATTFQPRIDPQGEEVLVLEGQVRDAWGEYGKDSWIRNPTDAWQAWGGEPGTVIFYKSGHLAEHRRQS